MSWDVVYFVLACCLVTVSYGWYVVYFLLVIVSMSWYFVYFLVLVGMLSSECKYEFVYCLFAELVCCMVPENMSWYVVNCLYSVVVLSGTVSMR